MTRDDPPDGSIVEEPRVCLGVHPDLSVKNAWRIVVGVHTRAERQRIVGALEPRRHGDRFGGGIGMVSAACAPVW